MYIDPDTLTFLMILFMGSACAYFIGYAMDGVMGGDGFGILPNTIILIAGGFLGFYATKYIHLPINGTTQYGVTVVAGGFASLAVLAMLKALVQRLGF